MVDQVVDLKLRSAEDRVARFLARRVPEEAGAGNAPTARATRRDRRAARHDAGDAVARTRGLEQKGKLQRGADGAPVADRTALTK